MQFGIVVSTSADSWKVVRRAEELVSLTLGFTIRKCCVRIASSPWAPPR